MSNTDVVANGPTMPSFHSGSQHLLFSNLFLVAPGLIQAIRAATLRGTQRHISRCTKRTPVAHLQTMTSCSPHSWAGHVRLLSSGTKAVAIVDRWASTAPASCRHGSTNWQRTSLRLRLAGGVKNTLDLELFVASM